MPKARKRIGALHPGLRRLRPSSQADFGQLTGQLRVALQDHGPVKVSGSACQPCCAHTLSQLRLRGQRNAGLGQRRWLNHRGQTGPANIKIIGVQAQRVAHGEITAYASWGQNSGHAKTINTIAHRVLVAVPVRHHHGQARRHRFHRRQAKGFLNIV